ncbi:MAG: hypothetical protein A3J76_00750 [Candidatus Moranbacteria bacterium RBG_13_45_13]|nr:MAG: hypothetical protein A3J76_00750 [Candidatus Moranbacteria bacterium RBG_13_45_13]
MEGSKKIHKNYKIYIIYILFFGLMVVWKTTSVSADSVIIENNVSATANTGGNVVEGGGEIQTGNASASSSSSTTVNGDGETKVEVKAKAEANGKKVEAEVKEKNPKEDINVQKGIEDDGSEAKVDIEINTNSEGNITEENVNQENTNQSEGQSDSQNTSDNFFAQATNSISKAIKGFFDNILSFFR